MSASVTSDEIKNELKTTLTARHGLGPEYDDAFIDSFMDKLGAKVVHELQQRHEVRPAPPPARPSWALTLAACRRERVRGRHERDPVVR